MRMTSAYVDALGAIEVKVQQGGENLATFYKDFLTVYNNPNTSDYYVTLAIGAMRALDAMPNSISKIVEFNQTSFLTVGYMEMLASELQTQENAIFELQKTKPSAAKALRKEVDKFARILSRVKR